MPIWRAAILELIRPWIYCNKWKVNAYEQQQQKKQTTNKTKQNREQNASK